MVDKIPNSRVPAICKCKLLYLGTNIYVNPSTQPSANNSHISLNVLQKNIASRYPIDGDKYARGIETWLNVYSNGIKMEHQITNENVKDSSFFYPIKSLIYCGALRFTIDKYNTKSWRFVPLDSDVAQETQNAKYPPMFVCVVKSYDYQKQEKIECHVFVAGMKKSAMKLVESCQQAYNTCKETVEEFFKGFNSIPAVFSNDNRYISNSLNIRSVDTNGYFYVIDDSIIDYWQLFEKLDSKKEIEEITVVKKETIEEEIQPSLISLQTKNLNTNTNELVENVYERDYEEIKDVASNDENQDQVLVDPYAPHPNLVKVEKRYDPESGQNIYVRWLSTNPQNVSSPISSLSSDVQEIPINIERAARGRKKASLIVKETHYDEEPEPKIIEIIREVETNSDKYTSKRKNKYESNRKQYRSLSRRPIPNEKIYAYEPDHYNENYGRRREEKSRYLNSTKLKNIPTKNFYEDQYRIGPRKNDYHRIKKGYCSRDYEKAYELVDDVEQMIDSSSHLINNERQYSKKDKRIYIVHEKDPSRLIPLDERTRNRNIIIIDDTKNETRRKPRLAYQRNQYVDDYYQPRGYIYQNNYMNHAPMHRLPYQPANFFGLR